MFVGYEYEIWPADGVMAVRLLNSMSVPQLVACALRISFDTDFRQVRYGLVDAGAGPLRLSVKDIHRLGDSLLGLAENGESRWAALTRHPHDTALAMLLHRQIAASRPFAILSSEEGAVDFLHNRGVSSNLARHIARNSPATWTRENSAPPSPANP